MRSSSRAVVSNVVVLSLSIGAFHVIILHKHVWLLWRDLHCELAICLTNDSCSNTCSLCFHKLALGIFRSFLPSLHHISHSGDEQIYFRAHDDTNGTIFTSTRILGHSYNPRCNSFYLASEQWPCQLLTDLFRTFVSAKIVEKKNKNCYGIFKTLSLLLFLRMCGNVWLSVRIFSRSFYIVWRKDAQIPGSVSTGRLYFVRWRLIFFFGGGG